MRVDKHRRRGDIDALRHGIGIEEHVRVHVVRPRRIGLEHDIEAVDRRSRQREIHRRLIDRERAIARDHRVGCIRERELVDRERGFAT